MIFFFVVIDVKLHVVDLLLLKPVHAVLQKTVESKSMCMFSCGDTKLFTVI